MVASMHALIQYGCYPLWDEDEDAMGNFRLQITEEDVGMLPAKDAGCEHHQKLGRNGRAGCYLLDLEPLPLALWIKNFPLSYNTQVFPGSLWQPRGIGSTVITVQRIEC